VDASDRERAVEELRRSGAVRGLEHLIRPKSGETRLVQDWLERIEIEGEPCVVGSLLDVTEARQAAEALRNSEARFRAAFDQAAVGMARREIEGRFLDVNRKLCEILGYTREELLNLTSVDITLQEERQKAVELNQRLRAGELSSYSREKRYLRKDGTPIWVNLSINIVNAADGRPDYVIAVMEDISQRKQTEEKLRKRTAHLRLLTENIPAAVAYVDHDLMVQIANQRYVELHCGAGGEAVGRSVRELVGERAWPQVERNIARVFAGESLTYERALERADGERREIEVHFEPDRSPAGEVRGYYAFILDVTERKRAEEIRAQLAAVVETSSDAIISRTPDGTILSWNEGAQHIFGYSAKEAVGRDISIIAPPEHRHESRQNTGLLQQGKPVPSFESVRVAKDGGKVDVQISVSAVRDDAGNITSIASIFRDITERKRAEEALRAS
ncbi:MAG: PAS domain S-box protein, partial [Chloroflexota bacterium]